MPLVSKKWAQNTVYVGLLSTLFSLNCFAKDLYWESFQVKAHLEKDGSVLVHEDQSIIFDGDWNGGERIFDQSHGMSVELKSISHWNPKTQNWDEVRRGDLSHVDNYNWVDSSTVRWRSRLPADQEFHSQLERYRLDFYLRGAGRLKDDGTVAFKFPILPGSRSGVVKSFHFELDADPEWHLNAKDSRLSYEEYSVAPRHPIYTDFTITPPPGFLEKFGGTYQKALSRTERMINFGVVFGLTVLVSAALVFSFFRRERKNGRFIRSGDSSKIDSEFLERHLYSNLPEVISFVWEERPSVRTVLTLLSKLQMEGKIKIHVDTPGTDELFIQRLVPTEEFKDLDRSLIESLIPEGDLFRSSQWMDYYTERKEVVVPPEMLVATSIDQFIETQPGLRIDETNGKTLPAEALLFWVAAFNFMFVAGSKDGVDFMALMIWLGFPAGVCFFVFSLMNLNQYKKFEGRSSLLKRILWQTVVLLLILGYAFWRNSELSWASLVSGALVQLGIIAFLLYCLRSKGNSGRVLFRKKLKSIRDHFESLLKESPQALLTKDVPYCVALGLTSELDSAIARLRQLSPVVSSAMISSMSWSGSLTSLHSISYQSGGGGSGGGGGAGGW